MSKVSLAPSREQSQSREQTEIRGRGEQTDPIQVRNERLNKLVFGLSALTFAPIGAVLIGSAASFWNAAFGSQTDHRHWLALSLGALTATAGLSAVVICLLLRLREHKTDEIVPPSLTGPLLVVALGTALALGAVMAR